jgi:DNA-binding NarL/FixJ family response regulator
MVIKRIMLVDDNAAIRRALHHVFDFNPDWDICGEASDGREGIEKAKALHPDLIVMDVSMPVMNGLEAARVIHETMPRTLVILCSLHTDDALRFEARQAGVRAIVSKTQNMQMLVSKARELLQNVN